MRLPSAYGKALYEIYSLDKFGSRLGLERIRRILFLLGNPEQSYKCVLVAGSNGKGSTVEMLGSILQAAGYRAGTYFSPQVEEFPERIRIDGMNVSKREIAEAHSAVFRICRLHRIEATFFEVVTAMALLIFKRRRVDFAVLEVGLGGRLDATNSVEPFLSAITSISLEHTAQLGRTLGKIAREKAGIARKGKRLVCGRLPREAKRSIAAYCKKIRANPIFTQDEVKPGRLKRRKGAYSFTASFRRASFSVSLSAPGRFQVKNALTALAAASCLGIRKKAIEEGLSRAKPKFRLQTISQHPLVIADCAHNPEAAATLASELPALDKGRKGVLLFSAMSDKNYREALAALAPHFGTVILTKVSLSRSATLLELKGAAKKSGIAPFAFKNPHLAYKRARLLAGKGGVVVVAGSIYLLAELFGRDKIRIAQ